MLHDNFHSEPGPSEDSMGCAMFAAVERAFIESPLMVLARTARPAEDYTLVASGRNVWTLFDAHAEAVIRNFFENDFSVKRFYLINTLIGLNASLLSFMVVLNDYHGLTFSAIADAIDAYEGRTRLLADDVVELKKETAHAIVA